MPRAPKADISDAATKTPDDAGVLNFVGRFRLDQLCALIPSASFNVLRLSGRPDQRSAEQSASQQHRGSYVSFVDLSMFTLRDAEQSPKLPAVASAS
jgi:hypothetical protein